VKKNILGIVLALLAAACGGGDGGGDDGLSCGEAFLCAADCETDRCIEDCMNDATPAGKQQMIDLAVCVSEAGCEDDGCIRDECGAEADACGGLDQLKPGASTLRNASFAR
jgi:hypothetical protein